MEKDIVFLRDFRILSENSPVIKLQLPGPRRNHRVRKTLRKVQQGKSRESPGGGGEPGRRPETETLRKVQQGKSRESPGGGGEPGRRPETETRIPPGGWSPTDRDNFIVYYTKCTCHSIGVLGLIVLLFIIII